MRFIFDNTTIPGIYLCPLTANQCQADDNLWTEQDTYLHSTTGQAADGDRECKACVESCKSFAKPDMLLNPPVANRVFTTGLAN